MRNPFRFESRAQCRSLFFGLLLFLPIPGLPIWHFAANKWGAAKVDAHLAFLESVGIPTDAKSIFPTPKPSDDEAMNHPAIIAEFAMHERDRLQRICGSEYSHRVKDLREGGFEKPKHAESEVLDLRTFFEPVRHDSEAEAAQELIAEFAPEPGRLRQIVVALHRPMTGWNVERQHYEGLEYPQFPELLKMRHIVVALEEHALLSMSVGDETAADDFLTGLSLVRIHHTRERPSIIHNLLAIVYFDIKSEILREGIRRGLWGEPTLAKHDAMLATLPMATDLIESMKTELGQHADLLRQMKSGGTMMRDNPFEDWVWELEEIRTRASQMAASVVIPRGLLLKAHVDDAREFFEFATQQGDGPRTTFTLADLVYAKKRRDEIDHDTMQASDPGLVWLLWSLVEKNLHHRTSIALLRTGIALERYRLRYGSHPESLDALVPGLLSTMPLDPYDEGQPLRYRRRDEADGSPLLWSIGSNRIDERGVITRNRDDGDRVWITSPVTPESTKRTR